MIDPEINGGRGLGGDQATRGDWTQMWSGMKFYPADPRPEEVTIEDIAFALGNVSRYAGNCRFFSVAEHSVLVSKSVPENDAPEALFHDAPEPYGASDILRPIKRIIGRDNAVLKLEKSIYSKAIAPKFGLRAELPESVVQMDTAILAVEKRVLHPRSDPWDLPFPAPDVTINCWQPPFTWKLFVRRYCEIFGAAERPIVQKIQHFMNQDKAAFDAQFGVTRGSPIFNTAA